MIRIFLTLFYLIVVLNSNSECQNWKQLILPYNGRISWIQTNNNDLYLKFTRNDTVYRSIDSGDSWTKLSVNGLPNSVSIGGMAFNKQDDIFIELGIGGIYKSLDIGQSWIACSKIPAGEYGTKSITALAFNSDEYLYAVTHRQGIHCSKDYGTTWDELEGTSTFRDMTTIMISSLNHIFLGTDDTAFRSTDNGKTWNEISFGFEIDRRGLVHPLGISQFIPLGEDKILVNTYGGGGLYYSENNGDYWNKVQINDDSFIQPAGWVFEKNTRPIIALGYNFLSSKDGGKTWFNVEILASDIPLKLLSIKDDGEIFATSYSSDILVRSRQNFTLVQEHYRPTSFTFLEQNYPNPFNPVTIIKYKLNESGNITLKIYNVSGQEIETVINGFQSVGTHEAIWQPKELPNGIYFYRLNTDNFSDTKKLILQK